MEVAEVRRRLSFGVSRLAEAAARLQDIDACLYELKIKLEQRALELADEGNAIDDDDTRSYGEKRVRLAQSQAVAQLARKAVLTEILRSRKKAISLMAAVAVSRWISSLRNIAPEPVGHTKVRLHIESGRVACRLLRLLRRGRGLKEGVSLLGSAIVVAEFVHPDDFETASIAIKEGLHRGLFSRSIHSRDQAIEACSVLLGEAAHVLEQIAARAEPAVDALLVRSTSLEQDVQTELLSNLRAYR
jgi:hypothetical protein